MIRHTVMFTLRHAQGSLMEKSFLRDADVLATIPGVEKFEKRRQVSAKNEYAFSFSMEFADQKAYDAYNTHPKHVAFVRDRWNRKSRSSSRPTTSRSRQLVRVPTGTPSPRSSAACASAAAPAAGRAGSPSPGGRSAGAG